MLQQAYTYVNMVWRSSCGSSNSSAGDYGDDAAGPQPPGTACLQQHIGSVQQVVQVTLATLLQQQHEGTVGPLLLDSSLQRQLEKLLKAYSKLRCSSAAAAHEQTTAAGSSKSSKAGRFRAGKGSKLQESTQQDQIPAIGMSCLPSALQLVLQHAEGSNTSNSSRENQSMPRGLLAWQECKALLGVADDARLPPGAAAAAVEQLLQELCSCDAPSGWDAAVFSAQAQLVRGMMLSCSSSRSSSAAGESLQDSPGAAAAAAATALTESGQQWLTLLCGQQASAATAVPAAAKGSRSRQKAGSRKGSSKAQVAAAQQGPDQACLAAGAEALQVRLGEPAAAQALAAAALSHCLLGLLEAAAAYDQQDSSSSNAPGAAAADAATGRDAAVRQRSRQDQDEGAAAAGSSSMSCESDSDDGSSDAGNACTEADAAVEELWGLTAQHLQISAHLFQLSLQTAGQEAGSSSGLEGAAFHFASETAAAVVQAWHIAGLQGWGSCQLAFASTLFALLPLLPGQQQGPMQHVQQLLQGPATGGRLPWLGLLLAPQRLVLPAGSCSSSSDEVDSSTAASSRSKKAQGKAAAAAAGSSDQGCLCQCQMQAERAAVNAATQQQQQQQQLSAAAGPPSDAQQLQQVQLLLASAQAATAIGDAAAALVDAEAALELCKRVVAATACNSSSGCRRSVAATSGLSGSSWLAKPKSSTGLYWHAVGLYMSGLLQLSEVHEASGNPEDALRVLKELLKLSSSCHCCYLAAVAQASISSICSKMGQPEKAEAAAEGAARWLLRFQQRQGVVQPQEQQQQQQQLLQGMYAAAAVAQAQAVCSAASGQHTDAQQQLSAAIQQLSAAVAAQDNTSSCDQHQQRPVCMLRWRAAGLQAQLQLQLAHAELQLQGLPAAVRCLQEALQVLAAYSGGCCDR
jgi:hypothetical protein